MAYLEEFRKQIFEGNFSKIVQLWEEYCQGTDQVDAEELVAILSAMRESKFADSFGKLVENGLPLWVCIEDPDDSYLVLEKIVDLQTNNSELLAETALDAIKKRYPDDPHFNERIRLVGLRTRDQFQGALAKYRLLAHMEKGKYVFHTAGWGTGEIMDISPLREMVSLEFENVLGIKHLTFVHAFNTLQPLDSEHFLARRFADPDALEEDAKNDPLEIIHILLRDLGPQTAGEIKDAMCELVIPEEDWTKWWQLTRSRLKKDTMIESPSSQKEPFILRSKELTHEQRLLKATKDQEDPEPFIQTTYSFVRDHPTILKDETLKNSIQEKLVAFLKHDALTPSLEFEIVLFLEQAFNYKIEENSPEFIISSAEKIEPLVHGIGILAFKKQALKLIRLHRKDWVNIFFHLLFTIDQNPLRDHIFDELNQGDTQVELHSKLYELQQDPLQYPEAFFWYFQKLVKASEGSISFSNKEGLCHFLEAYLILLDKLDRRPAYRDLLRKMYNLITGDRYAVIRSIIEGTDLEFIQEFLLLVAKCHSFSVQDKEFLRSLAQVVQPSLAPKKKKETDDLSIIWTTAESYQRVHDRMKQISTVEMIENAKEVESARELGDLRENSEYKYAVEKRAKLQSELKTLSKQMTHARVITPEDIPDDEVGVGTIVDVEKNGGEKISYTILGQWDANPETNVLSLQSQLAQAMIGNKPGDTFHFREEEYKVVALKSFLDQ